MNKLHGALSLNLHSQSRQYKAYIEEVRKRVNQNEKKIEDERRKQEILQELLKEFPSQSEGSSESASFISHGKNRREAEYSSRSDGTDLSSKELIGQYGLIKQFMKGYKEKSLTQNSSSISNIGFYEDPNKKKKTQTQNQIHCIHYYQPSLDQKQTLKPWSKRLDYIIAKTQKQDQYYAQKMEELKMTIKDSLEKKRRYNQICSVDDERRFQAIERQRQIIRKQIEEEYLKKSKGEKNQSMFQKRKRIFTEKADAVTKKNNEWEMNFLQTQCCISAFKREKRSLSKVYNRVKRGAEACEKLKTSIGNHRSFAC